MLTFWIEGLTLSSPTANAIDEKAAKEKGRCSDGGRQPGRQSNAKAEKPEAQSCALWRNTSVDQPVPEQHVPEWFVLE